jgi:transposase
MTNQFISNENRCRILDAYMQVYSSSQIASIMGFKKTTVYAIIKNYLIETRTDRKQKGRIRRRSLGDEETNFIKSKIDENCGLILKKIRSFLQTEKQIKLR